MEYIQSLRQYIGHAPVLMVGAAILIVDDKNRLLLMKRSDSGCWGPPGEATEPGEIVEEAARRNLTERRAYRMALDVELVAQQDLDETEEIEVSLVPFDEFVRLAKAGGLPQALHVSALFFA
ncbi:MAG: NUDIX domain-containing protein, partial [Anaerolineales bacterium]